MAKRINRDDLEKFHDLGVHVPSRTITLFGEINREAAENFIKNFTTLSQTPGDIFILLNTEGGDMTHGMAIYDVIKDCPYRTEITVVGEAYSMGAVVLQAAEWRKVTKHSSVMFHRGEISQTGTPRRELKSSWEFDERYSDTIDEIVYKKVASSAAWTGGRMVLTRERFDELNRSATYLRGIEAVEWGLADEEI